MNDDTKKTTTFPQIGEKVYFVKSASIVTVVEQISDNLWTVEKMNGKRLMTTTNGLCKIGPNINFMDFNSIKGEEKEGD